MVVTIPRTYCTENIKDRRSEITNVALISQFPVKGGHLVSVGRPRRVGGGSEDGAVSALHGYDGGVGRGRRGRHRFVVEASLVELSN